MAEQQMGGPTAVIYNGQFHKSQDDLPAEVKKAKKESLDKRGPSHGGAWQEFELPGHSGSGVEQEESRVSERGVVAKDGMPSDDDLMGMTKEELAEEAKSRNLVVTRQDGGDGAPTKADYVAALQQQ